MQVWNVLRAARWKHRTPKVGKNRHLGTVAQLCRAVSSQLRHVSTIGKNLLSSNMSFRCPHNIVNFGPLAAEIDLPVWGTATNFNGFRDLAALLHGSQVVNVSQTLRHWTEGATYVRQDDHHVGHLPTFCFFLFLVQCVRLSCLAVIFLAYYLNISYHIVSKLYRKQELISRWDSEREHFYDDIVHVVASAYASWTYFLSMLIYAANQGRSSTSFIILRCEPAQ